MESGREARAKEVVNDVVVARRIILAVVGTKKRVRCTGMSAWKGVSQIQLLQAR